MMFTGKISDSDAKSEFFGDEGTITVNSIEFIDSITHNKCLKNLANPRKEFNMLEEAITFSDIIKNNDVDAYEQLRFLSASVHSILEKLRKENNIIFSADIL